MQTFSNLQKNRIENFVLTIGNLDFFRFCENIKKWEIPDFKMGVTS